MKDKTKSPLPIDSLELASGKTLSLNLEPSETMVIYCADPRFRDAFREFIKVELGIEQHTLLSLAGGVGPFVRYDPGSIQSTQMMEQLRLFITNNVIKRVIALNHSGCKWYSHTMPRKDSNAIMTKQIDDLRDFCGIVRSIIDNVPVETFIAVMDGEEVCFRSVPTG